MLGNPLAMLSITALYFAFLFFIYPPLCLFKCGPTLKATIDILNFGYVVFVIVGMVAYTKKYVLKKDSQTITGQ